ncbi:MAG: nitroreductase family protein, partial [Muribaculaceae bacterium]|nr:nitroreductase family protein [Muribaculaceae bacterium]
MEKTVETTLLDRRSIRRYEREAISEADLEFIREAIRNTPTSYNGQQYSVIEVADQEMKEKLEAIVGQKQLKTCNSAFIFLSDYNKISVAAKA